jgi:hypothetical protein
VRDCAGAVSIGQASGLTRRYRSGNRGAWLLQRDLLAFQATYLSVGVSAAGSQGDINQAIRGHGCCSATSLPFKLPTCLLVKVSAFRVHCQLGRDGLARSKSPTRQCSRPYRSKNDAFLCVETVIGLFDETN